MVKKNFSDEYSFTDAEYLFEYMNPELDLMAVTLPLSDPDFVCIQNGHHRWYANKVHLTKVNLTSLSYFKFLLENGARLEQANYQIPKWAIYQNNLSIIKIMIDSGINVHFCNNYIIHIAMSTGNLELIQYLISEGYFNIKDFESIMSKAIVAGHLNIIKYMIDTGISLECLKNNNSAICSGNYDLVKFLLDSGLISVDQRMLESAISYGKVNLVELMIDYGCDPAGNNNRPIKNAIQTGNQQVINLLLKHGASVVQDDAFDEFIMSCFHINDNVNRLKILIDTGLEIKQKYIQKLCEIERVYILKYLLTQNFNFESELAAVFNVMCKHGDLDNVKYLISIGADIHASNESSLISAISGQHLPMVKFLIEQGADINIDNNCPVRLACALRNTHIVKLLLDNGAVIDSDICNKTKEPHMMDFLKKYFEKDR